MVSKKVLLTFAAALVLGGCSSAPGSHKTICTDHEVLCVVAGIAVFGGIDPIGTAAAIALIAPGRG